MRALAMALLGAVWVTASCTAAEPSDAGAAAEQGAVAAVLERARGSALLRTDYFESSKTLDDERGLLGVTAQLKALPAISANVDGKLEARLTRSAIAGRAETDGDLLEGYLTVHFDRADLKIGKQIVAWGRADGINPTDNLTPRDYTVP